MNVLEAMSPAEFWLTVLAVVFGVGIYEALQLFMRWLTEGIRNMVEDLRDWREEHGPVVRRAYEAIRGMIFPPPPETKTPQPIPVVGGWTPHEEDRYGIRPDPYWPYVLNEKTNALHRRDCAHVRAENHATWYWAQGYQDAITYAEAQELNVCGTCLPKIKRLLGV